MKKRLFSLALALAMCLGLTIPVNAGDVYRDPHPIGQYEDTGGFSEGLAVVVDGDFRYGYIDTTGKEVIPCQYYEAGGFSEGLAVVMDKSGKYGYIDKTGKEVIPCQYDDAGDFSEGLAWVEKDGKHGYIDTTGKEVVPCQYYSVGWFYEGLAEVGIDTGEEDEWGERIYQYGYIDKTGKEVIPCQYDEVYAFSDGLALVRIGGWYTYIDKTGKTVIPAQSAGTEAIPTNDKLAVNGVPAEPTVYKIGGGNYFKLRDLAVLLNGTSCQFDVGYDEASQSVTADSGKGYTKLDSDMQGPASANQTATLSNDKIIVNGQEAQVEVYKIDGGNYFKLRDLGKALNFYVGWTQEQGMFIETDKPYAE